MVCDHYSASEIKAASLGKINFKEDKIRVKGSDIIQSLISFRGRFNVNE
jgi:hypothetical protein